MRFPTPLPINPLPAIALLTMTVVAVCPPIGAQDRAPAERADAVTVRLATHAKMLQRIADDLRRTGHGDVAAKIEAQARRLATDADPRASGTPGVGRQATATKRAAQRRAARAKAAQKKKAQKKAAQKKAAQKKAAQKQAAQQRAARQEADRKHAVATQANPSQPPAVMTTPPGAWRIYTPLPKDSPREGDARIDDGRERFRYVPIATRRDASGALQWSGLPLRPGSRSPRDARPGGPTQPTGNTKPAGNLVFVAGDAANTAALRQRIDALAAEIRRMRAELDRLNRKDNEDPPRNR